MNIFQFVWDLWSRRLSYGDRLTLERFDDIQRQLNNLQPRDISPEFKREILAKIERVDSDVKRIATDD